MPPSVPSGWTIFRVLLNLARFLPKPPVLFLSRETEKGCTLRREESNKGTTSSREIFLMFFVSASSSFQTQRTGLHFKGSVCSWAHTKQLKSFCFHCISHRVATQGPAQIMPPFYYKIFYHKVISMSFYNISYLSTPYDILDEIFKLKL